MSDTATAPRAATIADLLASDTIEGHVTITGRITHIEHRTSGAGHDWAMVTITDNGLDIIDVQIFPKTYNSLTAPPQVGDIVQVAGRLCLTVEDHQLVVYGKSLDYVEL